MANAFIIGQGNGGGSITAVGLNGSPAPLSSIEIGFINASGNEVGVSATNPLPITGTISATNPSVGPTGVAAPAFATEIGIIDASGHLVGSSASNPVRIDPTGVTVQPVSGTITAVQGTSPWVVSNSGTFAVQVSNFPASQVIAGNLTNNNAAPAANNVGVLPALANAANPTWTEGDQVLESVDLSGHQRTVDKADGATAATVPTTAIQIGAAAATALPTAVAAGQLVAAMADKFGRQVIVPYTVRDLVGSASVQTTDASVHNLLAAGAAGIFNDISFLCITNETATATVVSLSDGTTTYKFAIPASGGGPINFGQILPATSAATAWTVTSSIVVTLDFVVIYAKNK